MARPGDRVVVPAGTPHRFRNAGEETAHFVCEVRPALGFEQLIETMFGLAADEKVNRKGMPNPLRLAVIARHHFDDVRLPFPPAWLQRLGLLLGAPLGRLLGYKPTHTTSQLTPGHAHGPHCHRRLTPSRQRRNADMSTATAVRRTSREPAPAELGRRCSRRSAASGSSPA